MRLCAVSGLQAGSAQAGRPLTGRLLAADGNKLFQSEFINVIHPGSNLVGLLEYNLLNSSVALFGYYFAAFTIDRLWMGRRRMQVRAPLFWACLHRSNMCSVHESRVAQGQHTMCCPCHGNCRRGHLT